MPHLNTLQCQTLAQFLASSARPACTMPIHELRGFLWGVASAPTQVGEDEWLSCVFDGEDPAFRNPKEEEQVVGLLVKLMEETVERMEDDEIPFPESDYGWHEDTARRIPLTAWCLGLLKAHYWLEDHWNTLLEGVQPVETEDGVFDIAEEVDMTLDIASLLADIEASMEEDEDPQALWASLPGITEQLPWIMMNYAECGGLLYDMKAAVADAPYRQGEAKIGHNDPCFCCSGKKYKHCCWNAANDDSA